MKKIAHTAAKAAKEEKKDWTVSSTKMNAHNNYQFHTCIRKQTTKI